MDQADHQTLINDIENLLVSDKGLDETKAKQYRKQAEQLTEAKKQHPLHQDLLKQLKRLSDDIHAQVETRDKNYEQVLSELSAATSALKQEQLATAEKATQKALSLAGHIHGLSEKRRAEIDKQLDKIYPQMRKLSAWRHWGTTQARENLIAQIKLIPGSSLEPHKIVTTLRAAKAQWQDWEQSGDHSEHKLWKTFSDACDTAYEPCREYFKQQKVERKENLNQKRALILEMETRAENTDWQQPEWKEIDKWLRHARGKFFKIGHTDYKHHKKLKVRLDTVTEQFETQLERERARSLKMRQKLITDIIALEQIDDNRQAISELDQLKKQWVITVLEKRGIENKLWDKFQKAQDLIYSKRNAERKQQDQARNENLKQKRLVIEKLLQAAHSSPEQLIADQPPLAQHIDQFNNIGYVPRKAEKDLMDSWRKAQKEFKQALAKAQKTTAKNKQQALLNKARFCAKIEQDQLQENSIDTEKLTTKYKAMEVLPGPLEKILLARFETAMTGKFNTLPENTIAQLECCLKLEVVLDLPTPDAFSKQRMAFQIERLAASMKKNTQAQEDPKQLKQQLLTCGAVDHKQFKLIWDRIDALLSS